MTGTGKGYILKCMGNNGNKTRTAFILAIVLTAFATGKALSLYGLPRNRAETALYRKDR